MNYSAEVTGKIIKAEREKRMWSQKVLRSKIGVSGKQISNYELGILMPPIDILIKLCDVYGCELGFLLNEENYTDGTKFMTAVREKIGLNEESVSAIMRITGLEKSSINFEYDSEKNRRIINGFLSSSKFSYFYDCLLALDELLEMKKNLWSDIGKKYSKEQLKEANECYKSSTDYYHDSRAEKMDNVIYEIIREIDRANDRDYELSYSVKAARYELNEAFESLINSIYPRGKE